MDEGGSEHSMFTHTKTGRTPRPGVSAGRWGLHMHTPRWDGTGKLSLVPRATSEGPAELWLQSTRKDILGQQKCIHTHLLLINNLAAIAGPACFFPLAFELTSLPR